MDRYTSSLINFVLKLPKPPTMCSLYCYERDQIERSKTHTALTVLLMHSVYDFLKYQLNFLMSGSCYLDGVGVECQTFVIVIFFNCGQVLQFGAHLRYYKGASTQKISFLVICATFRSDFHVSWKHQNKHSTLKLSFNTLSKWHEPDINVKIMR